MNIHRSITAITIATVAASGLGLGAGSASATGDYAVPSDPPPPTVGELVAPEHRQKSTTCEGGISCTILELDCESVGGTFTSWTCRDHGHTHGICTWPWE